jgi:hypothetical protein
MNQLLQILKSLAPVLEPLGEQGINALFDAVVVPALSSGSDNDIMQLARCLAPGLKQFLILEIQKLKN